MAMALFGMAVMIGPALGPTLGGYIVDHYAWPWIFYINLPVGVLALFMVTSFVHEPEDLLLANRAAAEKQRKHMDWAGIALLCTGIATLQYALEEGDAKDWFDSSLVTGCVVFSAIALTAFVIRELSATAPAVDLTLFKDPVFLSGTLIGGIMMAMLMAVTFLLPVFMQEMLGFTATQSGIALMPRTLVMMVFTPFVGKLYNRVSPRVFVACGVALFVFSAWQMSHYTLETSATGIVTTLAIQGIAFSCLWVPLTTVALSTIPRHKMADATGSNSLVRQIGASVGLAMFATFLSRSGVLARGALASHVTLLRPEAAARVSALRIAMGSRVGVDAGSAGNLVERVIDGLVRQQSMVLAFERAFLMAGIAFLAVLPLLWFLRTPEGEADAGPPRKVEVHIDA